MSSKNTNGAGQPLTRRQIRELEETKARAAADAASAPEPSAPATGTPAAVPVLRTPLPPTASQPAVRAAQPTTAPIMPPTRSAGPAAGQGAGPTRVSAATRIANGAGPTSQEAKRAPNPAVMPTNLTFAKDAFGDQSADTRVSRRSIREVGKGTAEAPPTRTSRAARAATTQVPEVVPPSQTSAIRRLDETGELSTITAAGETVPFDEVATTVTRKSVWAARTPVAPAASDAVAPATEAAAPAPTEAPASDAERAAAADQDTAMMMALAADLPTAAPAAPDASAAPSPFTPVTAEPVAIEPNLVAPAESLSNFAEGNTDLTFRQAVLNEALDADISALPQSGAGTQRVEPAQVAPVAPDPAVTERAGIAGQLPHWDDITAPDSDLPTDVLPDAEVLGRAELGLGGVDRDQLAQADAIADVAEPVVEVDHSYTWLHYLIIVAIAAVLGMVVWKVALQPDGETPTPPPSTMGYSVGQTLL